MDLKNDYYIHRYKLLKIINFIAILQMFHHIVAVSTDGSQFHLWFHYIVLVGTVILMVLIMLSFIENLHSYYSVSLIGVVWILSQTVLLEAIITSTSTIKLFMSGTMLILSYTLLESKRIYYIMTTVVIFVVAIGIIIVGTIDRDILSATILYAFISFIFYIIIEYREKLMNAYMMTMNVNKRLLSNSGEAYALHQMLFDEDGRAIDYRYMDINEKFTELTGLTRGRVIGKTVLELMPNTEQYWIETYAAVVKQKQKCSFVNYSQSLDRYYRVMAYPEEKNRFVTLFTDVSDKLLDDRALNMAMKNAQRANEFKSQFLKDVNHKLRTPLNGMMGLIQLVDKSAMDEEQLELIDGIEFEMNRSRNILNQIAEYVKIQDIEYVVTQNDLDSQISDIIDEVNCEPSVMIRFINNCSNLKGIFYERRVTEKILTALIYNALKHSGSESIEVIVDTFNSDDRTTLLSITVRDKGIGIAEEMKTYLFNELHHHDFVKLERDENQVSLPVCKMLIEQIGGQIALNETDIGASFTIQLPIFDKIG